MSNTPNKFTTEQEAAEFVHKMAVLIESKQGSDIFLNGEASPAIKVDGLMTYLKDIKLSSEDMELAIKAVTSEKQFAAFLKDQELNFMLGYEDLAHFRCNAYKQRGEYGLVMRLIPLEIPDFNTLGIPEYLKDMALLPRGLVIFSGATGHGKSTSLAALIDYRNEKKRDHIITIEDPIEFMHRNKNSLVIQREVGVDTDSYARAMKSALRQAPNAILVGEIRDAEVMQQALNFSTTGHLVFATVHATSTRQTLERIVNFFPKEQREMFLEDLASDLRCVVCQRLMKRSAGGRIPAIEIMTNTPYIQELILQSRLHEISEAMDRATMNEGIITFDKAVFDIYEDGLISYEEALATVDSPNNFRIRLRTESELELPQELQADESSWDLETTAQEDVKRKTFGSFSKS